MAKTVSHRDLRNRSGEVLREVARGETYEVTNRGEVVARLTPPDVGLELRCIRPAVKKVAWATMPRQRIAESTGESLDELRGERD